MIDYFVCLLGLPELRRPAVKALSQEERDSFQAYTDGVNAYLLFRGQDLPLEFRALGLAPEPWAIEDLASSLALNAWFLQTNYTQELLSIKARSKLELKQRGVFSLPIQGPTCLRMHILRRSATQDRAFYSGCPDFL